MLRIRSAYEALKALLHFTPIMMEQTVAKDRLVWVDLEMTGLDINNDHILEMACLVTDSDLHVVAKGPNIVIKQTDEILENMNDWCVDQHGKSGLTNAVRESKTSLEEAEYLMLSFIRSHVPMKQCPLAGNSVHVDKMFLDKYMPQFVNHLHYRIVDVSTIKQLCRWWYPNTKAPAKGTNHRAMEDILESIEELRFYKQNIFKT